MELIVRSIPIALLTALLAGAAFAQTPAPAQRIAVSTLIGSTPEDLAVRLGGVPTHAVRIPVGSVEATPDGVKMELSPIDLDRLAPRCEGRFPALYGIGQDGGVGSVRYVFMNNRLAQVELSSGGQADQLAFRGCAPRQVGPSVAEQTLFALLFSPVIVPTAVSRAIKHAGDEGRREAINAALGELALGAGPEGGVDAWAARHADVVSQVPGTAENRREFVLSVRPGEAVRDPKLPAAGAHVAFVDGKVQRFWSFYLGGGAEIRACAYDGHFACA